MNQRDPFEAFRRSSETERSLPFREEDWDDLDHRLNALKTPTKVRKPSTWWLLLLLLPIVGGFLLLNSRVQHQQVLNQRLLEEVKQLRLEAGTTLANPLPTQTSDTVFVERIVYRDRPGQLASPVSSQSFAFSVPTFNVPANSLSVSQSWSLLTTIKDEANETAPLASAPAAPSDAGETADIPDILLAVKALNRPGLPYLNVEQDVFANLPSPYPAQASLRKPRINRQPLVRSLGLTVVNEVSVSARPPEDNIVNLQLALRLKAGLGDGWFAFGGLASRFSAYDFHSEDHGLTFPAVPPPAAGYALSEIRVSETAHWWLLGAGWELPSKGRWQPFGEFSYQQAFGHESELAYDFLQTGLPDISTEIDATLTPRPSGYLNGGIGLRYRPKRSATQYGLGATYAVPLAADALNQPRLGVNIHLGFKF